MYLVHGTTINNLLSILKTGEIKSNELTGKINQGEGIYDSNKYVYFLLERELFKNTNYERIKLYFKLDLLYNRNFYLSTVHSGYPNYEDTWTADDGKQMKKKYPRFSKNIDKIIKNFYHYNNFVFFTGQVAIKNKANINNYLVGIEFLSQGEDTQYMKKKDRIIKLLKKQYPNVSIKETHISSRDIKNNIRKEQKYVEEKK